MQYANESLSLSSHLFMQANKGLPVCRRVWVCECVCVLCSNNCKWQTNAHVKIVD